MVLLVFFFFQAEDGIRDRDVTGVQSVLFRSASQFSLQFVVGKIFGIFLNNNWLQELLW